MSNNFSIGDIVTTSGYYRHSYLESGNTVPPGKVGIILQIAEYNIQTTGLTIRYGVSWFDWQPKIKTPDGNLWYSEKCLVRFGDE